MSQPMKTLEECGPFPARAESARACALRALGLLLAVALAGAPTVGRGKTF